MSSPIERATFARNCFRANDASIQQTLPHITSSWAGHYVEVPDTGVIYGPIIPKVGSMSFRSALSVLEKEKRSPDIYMDLNTLMHKRSNKHDGSIKEKMWFAVVRNPVKKMISGYKQVSGYPGDVSEECRVDPSISILHSDSSLFCRMSAECQERHFQRFFTSHLAKSYYNTHRTSQTNWLSESIGNIQALIRLESLQEDLAFLENFTKMHSSTENHYNLASKWFHEMIGGEALNRSPKANLSQILNMCARDNTTGKFLLTMSEILQLNAMRFMNRSYVRDFFCNQSSFWDFKCLGYPISEGYCDQNKSDDKIEDQTFFPLIISVIVVFLLLSMLIRNRIKSSQQNNKFDRIQCDQDCT